MENEELNNRIQESLQQFEGLENISPSNEWNESLRKKLTRTKSKTTSSTLVISVALLCILNLGFAFTMLMKNNPVTNERDENLKLVSQELFINPITTNN